MPLISRPGVLALLCLPALSISAQTNVLTQHNDIGRTGQNLTETILTPANVSSGNFGLLTSLPLDGPAFAQPLYMSGLNIGGVNHSVVFVATNHDSVYAWDAGAGGQLLWKAGLFDTAHGAAPNAIPDPVPDTGCVQVNGPEYGVMGTPVIDPATNTMYVVSKTYESNYPVQRLHALDVTTGAEKLGGPVTIQATVAGTGSGSVNGQLSFDPKWQMQRPGLLLLNGTVYIAFGSMCDFATWHGWVMGYSASTLAQTAAFITSPNGAGSGVWMSGAGLAADNENGVPRILTTTGNGTFDATTPYGTNTMDYGDDFVTLNVSNGIKVTDTFTPSNQLYLQQNDVDVSSGGLIVLPDNLPGSSVPHEAVQMSKAGVITVLNRDNLGGYNSTDQVLQEFNPTAGNFAGLWGMPAYWNGNVYVWPSHAAPNYNLLQFKFTNGLLSTSPVAISTQTDTWQNGQFLGASPSISANQSANGILWVADTGANLGGSPQYFYALDATNVANTLWSSTTNARDNAGIEQHCVFPTIADGRVFLEATGQFLVYGLLDFTMTAPSSVAVNPGNNTLSSIALASSTSFTQGVSFTASRLPSGVSVSFSQTASGAATAAFVASSSALPGTANVTVTGTRGTTTETVTIPLTVGGLADFVLAANPATVNLGTTGFATVTATPQNGFNAVPSYSLSNLPAGITASLAGCSGTGCTLLITASPVMTPGSFPITIQAASGSLLHSITTTVTVARTAAVNVDMSKSYNVNAIASDGTAPTNGGLDGGNYAFSGTLLNASLTWAATTFKLGPPNAPDAVSNTTVTLPAGNFVNLQMLASGGGAIQQSVTVTYTDGSTSTFNQSFSNWGANSSYSGESIADSMAYRLVPGGTQQNGPWFVYGYTFPLNSAKTVQSITLPPTNAVVVLAMSLTSSSSTAQVIAFPAITAQQPGTSVPLNATASSGLAITYLSATTAVCAVAGSAASLLAAGTCTITANQAGNSLYAAATPASQSFAVGTAMAQVGLAPVANVYAIANDGVAPANGGFDNAGYAYSEKLLGTSLAALGVPFTLGSAGVADAVSSTTIAIPGGSYSSLNFLAAGAFGNFANQSFVLTFTDNTTTTYTQSISDWCTPQSYPGETIALSMAYRVAPGGPTQTLTCDLYAYSIPVPAGKTVKSFTLPASRNIVVLAVSMAPLTTAAPSYLPAPGAYASAQMVTLSDSTPGASIYYTTNGGTPTSASSLYTSPLTISSSETVASVAIAPGYANSAITYAAYTINGPAAAPTFSVPGGSYTAAQTVALGDTTPGAKVYYTTNGTTPTTASALYAAPITLSTNETINALAAAAGYANSAVSTAAYSFGSATSVSLSSAFNTYGIFNSGTVPTHGGLDSTSYAYAGSTLPTSITLGGAPVTFGPVAAPDAITNAIVALPRGQYSSISVLAADSYGPLLNQAFVVTYSDATTSTFTQNMSDWGSPQSYPGETTIVTDSQRIIPSGVLQAGPWYMYGYTFALNSAKTVSSITLPAKANVFVFAITLQPPSTLAAQTITFAPIASQSVGAALSLSASATSGAPVTFTTTTASVCTVSGNTASLVVAGTCSITASQGGNNTYAAAPPVIQSFAVTGASASQTITFNPIATQTVGTPLALSGTASSGLPVSYASSTNPVCTVSNATATFLVAGTCTVTASQSGNASNLAATSITQSFAVQTAGSSPAGYDVVLLVGQSNMVGLGTGTDDAGDAAADPRIMQWNAGLGAIRPAFDPLIHNSIPYNIGMGMTFAKAYTRHMAPNRKLLLVGAATGATGFAGGYWLPPSGTTAGGVGATTALSWVNAAMAAAGANARFVGILWHQGENDIAYSGASTYETNLQNLISYFRTNITGAGITTPFVAGEMVNPWLTYNLTASASSTAGQIVVLNDFHTLPDTVPYTAWTSAASLASDPFYSTIHFSALSQRQLGRRYADKFFEAQNNLPQPQVSQKWWAGTFYDDGRGLGSANTNAIPVNNPATVSGTVTAATDPVRGNVAQISQGHGYLSYQVPGTTFNASYTKMAWFLPGAAGSTNNLISANNSGQIHYLYASNQGSGAILIAAGHSAGAVSNIVSAQVTNPTGAAAGWMNIALVYNAVAQTMTLYVNGAVIASQSGVAPAPSSTAATLPVYVGSYGTLGYGIDGEITGSRVWSTALSAAQVSAIYNYEAIGTGNEPGFGIVLGASSQAAYSPANPGVTYNVPAFVAAAGSAATSLPVTILPNNGFTGSPTLALSGLPAGASYTLTPTQTANAYTLQISGLPTSSVNGGYPLILSGTSSTVSAQAAARICLSVPDSSGNLHVDLSCFYNRGHNLVTDGTIFTDGGLAATGFAFSANLLGATVTSGGVQFSLGTTNGINGLSAATVNLPAGQYSSLALLGTGINGAQTAQTFTVTYSDGTTSTFTQNLSDWATAASYSGETVAASMAYVDASNGAEISGGPFHLYSYAFALNNAKTVASITTPNNTNVIVMAMTLKH